jgi:hypothetical protein
MKTFETVFINNLLENSSEDSIESISNESISNESISNESISNESISNESISNNSFEDSIENSIEDSIDKKISLIENLFNYIEGIIKNKFDTVDESTIKSLNKIIYQYYNERIDYNSDYFDTYAYVNDMNEDILESDDIGDYILLDHFNNYIGNVLDGEITEAKTIDSIYLMIKFYYNERCLPTSDYFDSYAFTNDLNEVLDDLGVSDISESESSEPESEPEPEPESEPEPEPEPEPEVKVDPFLSKFINENDNSDILLYQKNNKYVGKLEKFLNINKYY